MFCKCDHCDYESNRMYNIRRHVKNKHESLHPNIENQVNKKVSPERLPYSPKKIKTELKTSTKILLSPAGKSTWCDGRNKSTTWSCSWSWSCTWQLSAWGIFGQRLNNPNQLIWRNVNFTASLLQMFDSCFDGGLKWSILYGGS